MLQSSLFAVNIPALISTSTETARLRSTTPTWVRNSHGQLHDSLMDQGLLLEEVRFGYSKKVVTQTLKTQNAANIFKEEDEDGNKADKAKGLTFYNV